MVGLSQVDAEAAIVAAGLTVGTVSTANSDTIPVGNVFYQTPAGGSAAEPGISVDLFVSSGPPPAITCAGLIQEAETGVLLEGFEVGDDPAASGGQYVAVPEGFGSNFQLEGNGSQARYCFTIAEAGTYRIKGNIHGNGNSNSLFVQVDGLPTEGYNWVFPTNTEYLEDYVNGLGNDPVEVALTAGDHFVTVTLREDGARLDKLELEFVAGINIEKLTNGVDADVAPGPIIPAGGGVIWMYVVHNTGNLPLTNVAVTDDQGVAVSCSQDTLAVGESMTCMATGTAQSDQYQNVGTATAKAGPTTVISSDPSHYFGSSPAIDIEKATNGQDADSPPGPDITAGTSVNWSYVVTNSGNITLSNISVTDDQGVLVSCPQSDLAAAESMTCTASGTAQVGQYVNVGLVTGDDPIASQVSDSDSSHYTGVAAPATVPDVTGLPQAQAEAAILAASLTVGNVTTANSDTVPTGNVISQDPVGGSSATAGSPVDLVVSLGPVVVTVPDVTGLPQAQAEAAIVAASLTVGSMTTASSDTVPAGNVISQDPAGGSSAAAGSPVDIVISSGPGLVTVPDVVGLFQADAEIAIIAIGLTVGNVTTANSDTVAVGNVISQNPVGGTQVAPASAVDLVISLGPASTTETVRDEFNAVAYNNNDGTLNWAGNWIENDLNGAGPSNGNVLITNGELSLDDRPNTGSEPSLAREADLQGTNSAIFSFDFRTTGGVDSNDSIEVEVSSDGGATWTVLENFTGISGATAGSRVYDISGFASSNTRIRFRVNELYGGSNEDFLVDNVEIQFSIAAVSVPDVVGSSLTTAQQAIVAANLTVGNVTLANSDTVPVGNVISQDPVGGSSVVEGTPVNLVASLGSASTTETVRDEFNAVAYNNNDGTLNWAGDWIENDPDGAGPNDGNVLITNGELSLDDRPNTGSEPSLEREANLQGATSAIFSFGFRTTGDVDPDDSVEVEVSSDGGQPGPCWRTSPEFRVLQPAAECMIYPVSRRATPGSASE